MTIENEIPQAERQVIQELRDLCESYVRDAFDFDDFYPRFCPLAHQLFELSTTREFERVKPELRREVGFYLQWEGFGPFEGHLPLNPAWKYGDLEAYGWIDKRTFRQRFVSEFKSLQLGNVV